MLHDKKKPPFLGGDDIYFKYREIAFAPNDGRYTNRERQIALEWLSDFLELNPRDKNRRENERKALEVKALLLAQASKEKLEKELQKELY